MRRWRYYKKTMVTVCCFALAVLASVAGMHTFSPEPFYLGVYIPASEQRAGDAQKGYHYLVEGDYIKSGIAYGYFRLVNGKAHENDLGRTGRNATVPYNFNVVKSKEGPDLVVPNCLQCHAQVFEGKLVVGMGNTSIDFSNTVKATDIVGKLARHVMQTFSPLQYQAALPMMRSFLSIYPHLRTSVQGVNAADRLAVLLVAHRDPVTLSWNDEPLLEIPDEVVPTDVPAWWLLKKKNAMFYNGFGRGDFGKFLMLSNLLTVKDSAEARETATHFGDVLSYLKTIEPPKYPYAINKELAVKGKLIFIKNCAACHGSYGANGQYPNLLIPAAVIRTDSLLFKSNYQNSQFIDWFNKSWYAQGDHPAKLQPFNGYIAPPLDGIWCTAPYLHNGSVPNLQALLNSQERPRYWQRDFKNPQYDYENIGWKYQSKKHVTAGKTYNTDLPGYRNTGHTFGDHLDAAERKALLEYLKTL